MSRNCLKTDRLLDDTNARGFLLKSSHRPKRGCLGPFDLDSSVQMYECQIGSHKSLADHRVRYAEFSSLYSREVLELGNGDLGRCLENRHGSKTPVFGYHSGSERALIIPAFWLIPSVHKRTRENSGKSFKSIVNLRFRPNSIAVMGR